MHPAIIERKAQQSCRTEQRYCKGTKPAQNEIPASWNLNALQRDFIESMFEDKKQK